MSLLDGAATPVGTLAIFCRHADTPLMVKGSGTGTAEVSVTPTRSTSRGAGGLIVIEQLSWWRCECEMRNSEGYARGYTEGCLVYRGILYIEFVGRNSIGLIV